jgi:2',3'-cyclic-nucleotide 2'-phosphodiesterase/3'-nucleotidase/5'-nucleotidase
MLEMTQHKNCGLEPQAAVGASRRLRAWIWAILPLLLMFVSLATLGSIALGATVSVTVALDSTQVASSESNFGNLVCDAILSAAPDAEFALCPAAEIDPEVIDAGKVSTERIASALRSQDDPNDTVEVMTLTGAQVRDALAHAVSRAPNSFEGFLQVSGLTVRYDSSRTGAARIVSIVVTKSGREISPKSTYKVAMPHYLADGALGYFEIWANATATDTGAALTDAVTRFVTNNQPVAYNVEGRINKA